MQKRIVSLTVCILFMLSLLGTRVGYIALGKEYNVSKTLNTYSLKIDSIGPNVYYRDMTKATNNKTGYVAVIRPSAKCIGELNKIFSETEIDEITTELSKGYPIIKSLDEKPKSKLRYIQIFHTLKTENRLNQIISKQSNGILNHIPDTVHTKSLSFSVDAQGRLLDGDMGEVINDGYDSPEGYVTSLDKRIQNITLEACKDMKQGCALVMNVEDNSILACVNKPDESYLIKAFSRYAVGSVFKLVVCACALENDIDLNYNCTGSIVIGDTTFSCQNNNVHNTQNLKSALANSCNCYFVNIANTLGRDRLLDTAERLGFNDTIELFDKWYVKNATLPSYDDLGWLGELSLFGFGQGRLTVTPLQIGSFLCTVANNGQLNYPRLFLKTINNEGIQSDIDFPQSKAVLSESTCEKLLEYMTYVVTNGTGVNAQGKAKKSAGKTATAQTGQYILSHEYLNTWFAGVYPCDNPKYAIVVMTEKGKSGSQDCCPIFATIVDELENL